MSGTQGIFVERNNNGETYWEVAEPYRGVLPYVRLYGANAAQAAIVSAILWPSAGTNDLLSRFIILQGQERHEDATATNAAGTYIRIDFGRLAPGIGAQFVNDAAFESLVTSTEFDELIRDAWSGSGDPNNPDTYTMEDYDGLIRVGTTMAIHPTVENEYGIDTSTAVGISPGGNRIYNLSELPDRYFQEQLGLQNYEAFVTSNIIHEFFHIARQEPTITIGGNEVTVRGHTAVYSRLFSAAETEAFAITRADILSDPVEAYTFQTMKARGMFASEADENKYLDSRITAYTGRMKDLAGGTLPATAGELQELAERGMLTDGDTTYVTRDPDSGELVVVTLKPDEPFIKLGDADVGKSVVSAASALGSSLGRRLFGDNRLAGALGGAVLGQVSAQIAAEALSAVGNTSDTVEYLANRSLKEFGIDAAGAGAGALTAYLVGEVFAELGIDGFAGEAFNAVTSFTLSTIASNITKNALGTPTAWNAGLEGANFANFAGSWLGTKLASFVHTFDSVGGQIGFSVGSAAGAALAASAFAKSSAIVANFLAPGVGAFVGALLGGVIGSLFGGSSTPESGAHVVWNASLGEFTTGATWADDWGSSENNQKATDRALAMATTASDVLNRIVEGLGDSAGSYQNPHVIGAGAYGQESEEFVYWGNGENSQNHYLTGNYDDPMKAINHGLRVAMDNVTIQGGDIYLKRALYKSLEANTSRSDFDFGQLIGDLSVAADYSFYKKNQNLIDSAIALAPSSALAQGWVLTLLRGAEMDFDRFHKSDFYGGLHGFIEGSHFLDGVDPAKLELTWQGQDLRISDGESVPGGKAHVDGWSHYTAETTRWRMVEGPDSETVTAMETGQYHESAYGGGVTSTNSFAIDDTKTYEYSIYVQGHQLNKHRAYFGTMSGTVVNAVTGAANNNPYFWNAIPGNGNTMQADRWYKVVAYVLPEGQRLSSNADMGGVYDTVTGEKIANVNNFAWNPSRTRETSAIRFFNYYNETNTGYSTYWYAPQARVLEGGIPTTGNLVDLEDWPDNPSSSLVIDNFAATMGYRRSANITANYTGSIYSDIVTATGTNDITIADAVSASSLNGPGMSGNSRLSDDIFIGNDGNNQLYGYAGWDWLDGGAGVDLIYGGEGNDFIKGGDGNDYVQSWTNGPAPGGLYGENGDDTIQGGAGKDAYFGGNGNDLLLADDDGIWDYMNGQGGNDTVSYRLFERGVTIDMNVGKDASYTYRAYGDGVVQVENVTGTDYADTITGDSQNNILDGGSSDDVLSGGTGNDTLIGGLGADTLNGNGGKDTVSYRHSGSGVTIDLLNGTAEGGDAYGDTFTSIESIEGSQYADDLRGRTAAGKLSGLGGSDTMRASSGAIHFDGGEGADTVDYALSTAGVTVNLGSGTGSGGWAAGDQYTSIEQVIGSGFADYIYGTSGDERFQGGAGTDRMYGYGGDDSYGFTDGSGTDYIYDNGGFYDYVLIDQSISLNDLTMSESGSTLVIGRKSASDRIYVQNHFSTDSNGLLSNQMDRIAFANGSWLWVSHLTNFINGDGGANTLNGTGQSDWLHGYSGNDVINGGEGLDVLIGGAGTDTLRGGAHSDTYVFGRGSGIDIIDDTEGRETLVFAGDIRTNDLMMEYSGNDLYIGLKVDGQNYTALNAPDRVKIIGQKNISKAIEKIHINGQSLSLPKLVGDVTGSSNPPQVQSQNITIYARFNGGAILSVQGYDPEGDPLSYEVTSHTSYLNEDYYMLNGGSQLYTTAFWASQDYASASVTVTANDGTSTGSGTINITYAPDPMGGPLWPIVLDLNGNGVELIKASKSGVEWDVDEDGLADKIGWISGGDAFLALDRNGSGTIDDVSEISFIQDAEGATTDLEGLRGYDFDFDGVSDGVLDANDIFFADFLLWQDANGNGISDEGEVKTLTEHGITSIDLGGIPTGEEHKKAKKNAILNTGYFTRADGSTGTFGDVVLGVDHGGKNDSAAFKRGESNVLFKRKDTKGGTTEEGGTLAPIVIDFNLNGIELTPIARSTVDFDADSDGQLERIGWVEAGDAILALDAGGDGLITTGSEISFSQYAAGGGTDLDGLRTFDENGDGLLDASDAIWSDLSLWFDSNRDGKTQEGELISIADSPLASIELHGQSGWAEYGGNGIAEVTKANFASGEGFAGVADVSLGYLELAVQPDVADNGTGASAGVDVTGNVDATIGEPVVVVEEPSSPAGLQPFSRDELFEMLRSDGEMAFDEMFDRLDKAANMARGFAARRSIVSTPGLMLADWRRRQLETGGFGLAGPSLYDTMRVLDSGYAASGSLQLAGASGIGQRLHVMPSQTVPVEAVNDDTEALPHGIAALDAEGDPEIARKMAMIRQDMGIFGANWAAETSRMIDPNAELVQFYA